MEKPTVVLNQPSVVHEAKLVASYGAPTISDRNLLQEFRSGAKVAPFWRSRLVDGFMHDGEAVPPQIDEPIRMSYVGVHKAEFCWWPLRTYNPRQNVHD